MKRIEKYYTLIIILVCLVILMLQNLVYSENNSKIFHKSQIERETVAVREYLDIGVSEVLSGDSIRLKNTETVSLIGVDTPEIANGNKIQFDSKISGIPVEVLKVMGNEAMRFSEQLIARKRVRIEFDKRKRDNYGNLLGYVFILSAKYNEEDIFLNEEIIKKGYSYKIDTSPNRSYMNFFEELHEYAQRKSSELWKQWQR